MTGWGLDATCGFRISGDLCRLLDRAVREQRIEVLGRDPSHLVHPAHSGHRALLGEVGGVEEYKVCEALKSGRINKPMVAWCIGTCGDMFSTDVQVKGSTIFTNLDRLQQSFDIPLYF